MTLQEIWEWYKQDPVHNTLDIIGFIPVIGVAADGLNSVIYLVEGIDLTEDFATKMDGLLNRLGDVHAINAEGISKVQANLINLASEGGEDGMRALIALSENMDDVPFASLVNSINSLDNVDNFLDDLADPLFLDYIAKADFDKRTEILDAWKELERLNVHNKLTKNPLVIERVRSFQCN